MSEGFGMLSGLEKLNLRYCQRIQSLPDSESPHSESFYFYFLFSEGFGQLASLADLNMQQCHKLESLPEGQLLFSVCICLFLDCSAAHSF